MQLPPLDADARVSVVMAARDAERTLAAALGSALTQDHPPLQEVVVAVAPSSDRTAQVATEAAHGDARVRVVPNPRGTTPAGLNAAVGASTGEVIVRVDAHSVLPPGYVRRAVELLRETGAANVGGRQVAVGTRGFAAGVAAAMGSRIGAGDARYRVGGDAGDVDTVYLGVFRRAALDAVGVFDETLERNQDFELNHRIRAAGGRVYFSPDLAVSYTPRSSVRALWRQYHDYGRWKRRVLAMSPGSFRWRQAAPPILVIALVASGVTAAVAGEVVVLTAVACPYTLALLVGAAVAAPDLRTVPATALAAAVMHVAWGTGFLFGRPAVGAR